MGVQKYPGKISFMQDEVSARSAVMGQRQNIIPTDPRAFFPPLLLGVFRYRRNLCYQRSARVATFHTVAASLSWHMPSNWLKINSLNASICLPPRFPALCEFQSHQAHAQLPQESIHL